MTEVFAVDTFETFIAIVADFARSAIVLWDSIKLLLSNYYWKLILFSFRVYLSGSSVSRSYETMTGGLVDM